MSNLGDMSADEFRKYGREVVDWIADYYERIEEFPVLSKIEPGSLKDALPPSAPEKGEDFGEVLKDVDKLILPAVTHWNHPNFHGLFSTSTSSVGIFGEMLSAAFDMKAMLWRTSPASTELEDVVLDWLRQRETGNILPRERIIGTARPPSVDFRGTKVSSGSAGPPQNGDTSGARGA